MRQIGEQWIENGRMYKAVEGIHCSGCCHNEGDQGCYISGLGCPTDNSETDLVVHDLGPVNEDGLLACPFCGEYPKIGNFGDGFSDITFYVKHDQSECVICGLMRTKSFKTKQQAIDACNRRA